MTRKLIVANWKMYLGHNASIALATELSKIAHKDTLVLCPTTTSLSELCAIGKDKSFFVGAQNVSAQNIDAFTGEIKAAMLKEIGVSYVIIGHSERRAYLHESGSDINQKIVNAIAEGLTPVICVGEDKISYKSQKSKEVIAMQLDEIKFNVDWSKVVIAYEPIWSIGTGLIPKAEEIESMSRFINKKVSPKAVLYGGSVSSKNIKELRELKGVHGFLIGGASSKLDEMKEILAA